MVPIMKPNRLIDRILLIESEIAVVRNFSADVLNDMAQAVDAALARYGIVNIPLVAEQVRRRNEHENIALEDIEARIMRMAQIRSAPMEFDMRASEFEAPTLLM
jgi:hypothetical protein